MSEIMYMEDVKIGSIPVPSNHYTGEAIAMKVAGSNVIVISDCETALIEACEKVAIGLVEPIDYRKAVRVAVFSEKAVTKL